MKAIQEPHGPTVELINAPTGGTVMHKRMLRDLIKLAELNKATRLLVIFER